jgi:hypothetical protein
MEKNGRILFDKPKPTVGCSASGRRRILLSASVGTTKDFSLLLMHGANMET